MYVCSVIDDALCLSFTCWHLWTALMVTCYSETPHNDMVRLMIQSGADKYKGQWTTNSTDGYLLDEGAPVNTYITRVGSVRLVHSHCTISSTLGSEGTVL